MKWLAKSLSPTFHLVICFTLFPPSARHLAHTRLGTNNQLSRQIYGDSAVAPCHAVSRFPWIFRLSKKLPAAAAAADSAALGPAPAERLLYLLILIGRLPLC